MDGNCGSRGVLGGQSVWRGRAFEIPHRFSQLKVDIPVSVLQRANRLTIRNVSPESDKRRRPEIHYAVVKW